MNYEKWLGVWLEDYVLSTAKFRTYLSYRDMAQRYMVPYLGTYRLKELTPLVLQNFVKTLLRGEEKTNKTALAPSSVNMIITILQSSLKAAYELGKIKEYTAFCIKRPKLEKKHISCFSLAEQRQIEGEILQSDNDKLYGILLCLYTGLRIGELLALDWKDFDLKSGTLSVDKTCHYYANRDGEYGRRIGPPKTQTSMRVIILPSQLLSYLKELKKRSNSSYFISCNDRPVSVRSYQRTFQLLLKKLKIPHKGFHALRHTFATRALECGMDVKTLAETLGHKNATTTLNIYAHSLIDHKKAMMNKLGKLLK